MPYIARCWVTLLIGLLVSNGLLTPAFADDRIEMISLTEAHSEEPIDDFVRYFADKEGRYTPETIFSAAEKFIPLSEKTVYLRTHTHWYWIRMHNPSAEDMLWFITTGISTPPLLRAYWQSETYPDRIADKPYDLYVPGTSVFQYPLLVLPVTLKPGEVGNLLIEYQSLANFPLEIRPYTNENLIVRSQRLLFVNGAYMGAILVFFLFFAAQFFVHPNRVHLYYSLFVLSILLIMMQVSGLGSSEDGVNDGQHNSLITAAIGGSIYIWYFLFSTEFLELKKYHKKLHRVLTGLSLSVFILTLLGLFLPIDYILSVVVVLGLPWPIVAAVWSVRQKHPSAKFFLAGSTTHCFTTYLLLIACLGFETRSNEYFFALASVGLIFDICCFAVAILYQNNQLRLGYNRQLQERINDLNSLAESEQISAKALSMSKQAILNTAATAHDLQQPLSSMQIMVSLQDQQDPIVKQIKAALDYSRALLNSALHSSKEDYQTIRQRIDAKSLLEGAVKRHAKTFESKPIELRVRSSQGEVLCLPLVINRMLDNLLSNAFKYTHGGKVLVSGRKRLNGDFLIQVWDTGKGMNANQVKKLLIPFERLNEKNTENLGFGLGLFIVKSLCNQAGYHLDVRSKEGCGTCFSLVIPLGVELEQNYRMHSRIKG